MAQVTGLKDINELDLRNVALVGTGLDACLRGDLKGTTNPAVLKLLSTESCAWLSRVKNAVALGRGCNERIMLPLGVYRSRSLIGLLWDWMPEGSLHSLLYETHLYPELPMAIKLQILLDVAKGLNHLHGIPLPHGALKTTNVLLDHQYHAKLCDWGQQMGVEVKMHVSNGGTPCFRDLVHLAPEVILGNTPTLKADIYSFGVMIWEVLNRRPPGQGLDQARTLVFGQYGVDAGVAIRMLPPETPRCHALTQLMIRCCSALPERRPQAEECVVELRKALESGHLDTFTTAVHLLQSCKERAVLSCKHSPSWALPIELNNLEGYGGYTHPKNVTCKTIPVNTPFSKKTASQIPKSDEIIARQNTSFHTKPRASSPTGCCRDITNNSVGSSSSSCENPGFRQCVGVWGGTRGQAPTPQNTPCGSPTSPIQGPLQHPSAAKQAVSHVSSGRTCGQLLQERREAIVHFMTEGRLNKLLDVLRARQAVTREAYEIINAPITLSARTRCLLDTCACLGENVSVLVATTLGLVSTEAVNSCMRTNSFQRASS
ncbi:receptor-interacting serine/threonine-protein kinase 2 [Trichomycterus rosablanca]|uniref:receptor-interacting serine/threonine-protein kinase 2 n=1 Tax=Trichomycterus rosablanca TaxID=2290929 RepID=UPI002F35F392